MQMGGTRGDADKYVLGGTCEFMWNYGNRLQFFFSPSRMVVGRDQSIQNKMRCTLLLDMSGWDIIDQG